MSSFTCCLNIVPFFLTEFWFKQVKLPQIGILCSLITYKISKTVKQNDCKKIMSILVVVINLENVEKILKKVKMFFVEKLKNVKRFYI